MTYRDLAPAGIDPRRSTGPEGDLENLLPADGRMTTVGASTGRPGRILMTTTGHRARWDHSLDLAGALTRCGIEVALATLGEPPSHAQIESALRHDGLQVLPSRFGGGWSDESWDEVERAGEWLLRLEDHLDPDVIHLHGYVYGTLPFRAPTLLEGHDCPLCRWRALRGAPAPLQWERYRQAVAQALREVRMVVAPSEAAAEELETFYGALPASRVIPVGRSPRRLPPKDKEDIVLSAGCFGEEAHDLQALERVAREVRWPVAVLAEDATEAGNGASRPLRVLPDDSPERVASWYGRASIFALPCRYEPAGLSVLEAALSGCALVLGDVPALRELWQGAALFVAPGDDHDLRRALDLLISEPKGRRGLGQRARARALLLSPERRAASFLEAYAHLLREDDRMETVKPLEMEAS